MTEEIRAGVSIATDAWRQMFQFPAREQRAIERFVTKFMENPRSPGLNYEKINNAAETSYRSLRVTQDLRAIVQKPERGNVFVLQWIDRHDAAYAWAERTRSRINTHTGQIQVWETIVDNDEIASAQNDSQARTQHAVVSPERPALPLLALSEAQYLQIGVPEEMLGHVMDVRTESELSRLRRHLPVEVFEALEALSLGFAWNEVLETYGADPEEPIDPDDFEAALHRPHSQRRFHLFEDDEELRRMLDAPLETWRIYLHPSQRKAVEWDVNGPISVRGGAGTGKTVAAMHRAKWLITQKFTGVSDRIFVTTYTKNLAADIETSLDALCEPAERKRIEVQNLDGWLLQFLRANGEMRALVFPSMHRGPLDEIWKEADALLPKGVVKGYNRNFYREEWQRVILPYNITTEEAYVAADRRGRGTPLQQAHRRAMWPVFQYVYDALATRQCMTMEQAAYAAVEILSAEKSPPYQAVVVDEAQDFGPEMLRLLRHLAPHQPNDMFLVGDAHQRIYARPTSYASCGIEVRGRSARLRINYRTTDEIRAFATSVLRDTTVDDLDGGKDDLSGYRSLFGGVEPAFYGAESFDEEIAYIASYIEGLETQESAPISLGEMCLLFRTSAQLQRYQDALAFEGYWCEALTGENSPAGTADGPLYLATMHRAKGLGFKAVIIAGATKKAIPLPHAMRSAVDPMERAQSLDVERALFHVACTRAARRLLVTWHGAPSEFLAR